MDDIRQKYLAQVSAAADEAALEEVRIAALGKKGEVALMMRTLGQMARRGAAGRRARFNALRDEIDSALRAKKAALGDAALDERLQGRMAGRHAARPAAAAGHASTRSARSPRRSPRSSPTWGSASPKGRRSKATGTISTP